MKVFVNKPTEQIEMEMTNQQLAWAIIDYVQNNKLGHIDDAGCDWNVVDGGLYFGDPCPGKEISNDPFVAILVTAANIIRKGQ